MNVNKIVGDTDWNELCEAVLKVSHLHNVSRKQAYYMVVDRVRMEFNNWEPYKTYESFKVKFWKWQNGHR
jgi:hypothetical protein